ncbi:MAG: hypothetical protein GY803_21740 [Chloroflexi bacterium]|nr:hypothetical protein [Chloroflexota bacterium]
MSKKTNVITVEKKSPPGADHIAPPPNRTPPSFASETAVNAQNDLEDLREIFWGNHIRTTETRFNAVEARIETVNRSLIDALNDKLTNLAESSKNNLTTTHSLLNDQIEAQSKQAAGALRNLHQEVSSRLDRQEDQHSSTMRKTSRELMEYVDQQSSTQAANLRQAQKELGDRIDQLASDLLAQLGQAQKDLSQQITRLNDEQTERLNVARAEAQRRDDDLRQEMLNLTAALDDKATGRHDLGQMYMEIGRRLYNG